MGHDLR